MATSIFPPTQLHPPQALPREELKISQKQLVAFEIFESNDHVQFFLAREVTQFSLMNIASENILIFMRTLNSSLDKVKKSSKNKKDQQTLVPVPPSFLAAMTKTLFLGRKLGTRLCFQPTSKCSCYFPVS